ncbi:class I SAM-dependent methyltransferase [Bradyrhizobium sp. LHD-71]|uniref:class I SAM-dependent methyltransferase n=1 Tax=Bradyrhizobium sp. LHD-71 TaxID=3072141 RepID=UPI002810163A|nr:class I SAM-dependent methyltransferase [Bradyrhizobium sp. LHD-71]MDQ8729017.1 class I SAM-dependent methyltransferase [Bradyrhizobium sp. LHD-71]
MEQRFSFDRTADLYGTSRPIYPEALFDEIANFADLAHDDAVLELGCGTGQATRGFARQGLSVLALDPGAELLRVARQTLASFHSIEFVQATFEAWPPRSAAFKLVASAQAFHWIAPDVRFVKAAEVLAPRGTLAVFGNVPVGLDAALLAEFRRVYAAHGFPETSPPERWYLPSGPIAQLFAESELFEPTVHASFAWNRLFTSSSYVAFLHTRSDHQMMEAVTREKLIADIAQEIVAHGDEFEMNYETHLYMARRAS